MTQDTAYSARLDASPGVGAQPRTGTRRNVWKWASALVLFLTLSATLVSLTLFQLTSEGAAKRTLRRSVAALTEIDPLIARQYDDLQARADATRPEETILIDGYPLDVPLAPSEVAGASEDDIRGLVLERSADLMYEQGTNPLRESAKAAGDAGGFSVAGITDDGLGFLRNRNHDILAVVTFGLAVMSFVLAIALAAFGRGFGRVGAVGGVVLAAAIPVLLGGIVIRSYAGIANDNDSDYIAAEFLRIGESLAWVPIRNGLAFALFGTALVIVGLVCAIWSDRRAGYAS